MLTMLLVERTGIFKVDSTKFSISGNTDNAACLTHQASRFSPFSLWGLWEGRGGQGVGLMGYWEVNGYWREDKAF